MALFHFLFALSPPHLISSHLSCSPSYDHILLPHLLHLIHPISIMFRSSYRVSSPLSHPLSRSLSHSRSFFSSFRSPSSASRRSFTSSSSSSSSESSFARFWRRWTAEVPSPPRYSGAWWRETALICTVFAITGSSSMYLVRPAVKTVFGVEGTLVDGPWSYRLLCVGVCMPAYSLLLLTFGTLAGRHQYFKRIAMRMWGRFMPLKYRQKLMGGAAKSAETADAASKASSTSAKV